jgi:hypothetical protein
VSVVAITLLAVLLKFKPKLKEKKKGEDVTEVMEALDKM